MTRVNGEDYTRSEVEHALACIAANNGSYKKAERQIKEEGGRQIPWTTLRDWKNKRFSNQYYAMVERLRPRIDQALVEAQQQIFARASDLELEMLDHVESVYAGLEDREVSKALRDVSVTKGVAGTKIKEIRGEPTVIQHETRNIAEIMKGLEAKAPGLFKQPVIEGTAEEVK